MANHLTPTELAREAGLARREVLSKCLETGVPIFKGRIDKSLFMASVRQGRQSRALHTPRPDSVGRPTSLEGLAR